MTCRLDPEPTARHQFWFHRPELIERQVEDHIEHGGGTLRARLPDMPALEPDPGRLRVAQHEAITNLEASLKANRSRALIQMATGSGKTFAAAAISERLIRHAQAQRILFLVDRGNLSRQTLKEFQGFEVPGSGRKLTELYTVQRLTHNHVDPVASVCIGTVQRVYSMLRGDHLQAGLDHRGRLLDDLPPSRDARPTPRSCLVPESLGSAIVKANCVGVRLSDEVDSRSVNYALQRADLRRAITSQLHGVGRPRLGMAGIKALPVPLAPRVERERIVAALEEHLSRLDAVSASVLANIDRVAVLASRMLDGLGSLGVPLVALGDLARATIGLQDQPTATSRRHSSPPAR